MITTIEQYRALCEAKKTKRPKKRRPEYLIIVNVQEASKHTSEDYIKDLKKLASKFASVYQIWDPKTEEKPSVTFPNEVSRFTTGTEITTNELMESINSYFDEIDADFFKNELKHPMIIGRHFDTTRGDILVFLGNDRWYFCNNELAKFIKRTSKLKMKCILVGGPLFTVLNDVMLAMKADGTDVTIDQEYVYSNNPKI